MQRSLPSEHGARPTGGRRSAMNATESLGAVIPTDGVEDLAACLLCGQSMETGQVRRRYEENVGSYERLLRDRLEGDSREQVRLDEEQRRAKQAAEAEDRLRRAYDRRGTQLPRTNRRR